jgi:acyl-CoA thioesterase I
VIFPPVPEAEKSWTRRRVPILRRSRWYSPHVGVKRSRVTGILLVAGVAIYVAHEGLSPWNRQVFAASWPVFTSRCVGPPEPYPTPRHPTITFGDSITEGYGATKNCLPHELRTVLPESAHRVHASDTSYPGDLARLERRMVLNYGVGGELTGGGLPRLRSILRSVHPSTVFILEGINDLWGGRSTRDIVGNLLEMARSVKASGARPIILTVLPVDRPVFPDAQSKVKALNTAIRAMAKQRGVRTLNPAARFLGQRPLSHLFRHADGQEDGVHPNDAGFQVLAQTAAAGLSSH